MNRMLATVAAEGEGYGALVQDNETIVGGLVILAVIAFLIWRALK